MTMDDRLQQVEVNVKRLTVMMALLLLTLVALVVAAAVVTDIFKVDVGGTTRMTIDDKGTMTINADPNAADVALKILSAPNARGDIKMMTRATDPTTPQAGDFWYNTTEKRFKLFDGGFKQLLDFGLSQTVADA